MPANRGPVLLDAAAGIPPGLRWDAPHETAYPSTFILDRSGNILFEKISHSHGDRISAEEILERMGQEHSQP